MEAREHWASPPSLLKEQTKIASQVRKMGSFMLIRWVALRVCFIVLVVELHLALGWRHHHDPLFDILTGGGGDEDDVHHPSTNPFNIGGEVENDILKPLTNLLAGGEADRIASEGLCKASIIPHGYKCQEFHVTGLNGYIIGVQRIPEGCSSRGVAKHKPPVLVQHGVLVQFERGVRTSTIILLSIDSEAQSHLTEDVGNLVERRKPDGMSWTVGSTKESLVFALADSGFDVWVSNTRGTRFSKGHVSLDESQPEYWDWSWDDVAENDIPALVDFVYHQTGQKPHYIGHSMGTATVMAALSEGKLTGKLRSACLLSPIAYLNHMTTAIGIFAADAFVGELLELLGLKGFDLGTFLPIEKFVPYGKFAAMLLNGMAMRLGIDFNDLKAKLFTQNCCLNSTAFEILLDHELQPTSMKNMVHFAQTFRSGIVRKYDYGNPEANMEHYGKPKAPRYHLKKIPRNLPLFLSFGGNDELADLVDVKRLLRELKSHDRDKITTQFIEEYAHLDFVFATNVREKVYNTLIDFLRRHNNEVHPHEPVVHNHNHNHYHLGGGGGGGGGGSHNVHLHSSGHHGGGGSPSVHLHSSGHHGGGGGGGGSHNVHPHSSGSHHQKIEM